MVEYIGQYISIETAAELVTDDYELVSWDKPIQAKVIEKAMNGYYLVELSTGDKYDGEQVLVTGARVRSQLGS